MPFSGGAATWEVTFTADDAAAHGRTMNIMQHAHDAGCFFDARHMTTISARSYESQGAEFAGHHFCASFPSCHAKASRRLMPCHAYALSLIAHYFIDILPTAADFRHASITSRLFHTRLNFCHSSTAIARDIFLHDKRAVYDAQLYVTSLDDATPKRVKH